MATTSWTDRRPGRRSAGPRTPLLAVLLVVAASLSMGCRYYHDDDDEETLVVSNTSFAYDVDARFDSGEISVLWDTILDQGRVELRVRQFYEGSIRLRVYDDSGTKIFDEDYDEDFWPDDEYREVDFTAVGVPGAWEVRIQYYSLDGHLYVTID
ncbi:MAG: hypothetical protein AB7O52_14180 [Planctomycetota bacterium]